MTQPFAPQDHLIKIPRRVKTASGAWETVHDDYLEVKFRLVMFREKYPHGRITTEEVCVDLDRGYARFKATIEDGEGGWLPGTAPRRRRALLTTVNAARRERWAVPWRSWASGRSSSASI
jgi:hypothetical protein